MSRSIWVHQNGQNLGPYTEQEIREFLQNGQLSETETACWEGDVEWQELGKLVPVTEQSPPPAKPIPEPKSKPIQTSPETDQTEGINRDALKTLISKSDLGAYAQSTLHKDETPLYWTKQHWIIFLPSLYLILVAFVLSFVIRGVFGLVLPLALLALLAALINYKTSEYTVTNKRLIVKTGFIARKTHEIFISKLESVNVEQGILERALNSGTVTTFGTGGSKQKFRNISDPLKLRSAIQEIQAKNEK